MQKRVSKILGIISIILGVILLLNSIPTITSFVILENISKTASSVLGIILLISGVLLLQTTREKKSPIEIEAEKVKMPEEEIQTVEDAYQAHKLRKYLNTKGIVYKTEKFPQNYSKHTIHLGRRVREEEFLAKSKKESQFMPHYTVEQIRQMELDVATNGIAKPSKKNKSRSKIIIYGIRHEPVGAYQGRLTPYIAVELNETKDGKIQMHGYPVAESQVPAQIRKKLKKSL